MRPNQLMSTPLPPVIGSSRELLALAGELEQEAATRYRELADRMRLRQEPELENLFGFLASLEDKHRHADIRTRRRSGSGQHDAVIGACCLGSSREFR